MATLCECHTGKGIGSQRKGIHISLLQDDVIALMIAVYHGYSHIVEVLIRFKPDVNLQTKVGIVTYCSVCTVIIRILRIIQFNLRNSISGMYRMLRKAES